MQRSCPFCGRISAFLPQCPHCGKMFPATPPPSKQSFPWAIVGLVSAAILVLAAVAVLGVRMMPHPVEQAAVAPDRADVLGRRLHRFQEGDQWTFRVDGTLTMPDGQSKVIRHMAISESVEAVSKDPRPRVTMEADASARLLPGWPPMMLRATEVNEQDPKTGDVSLISQTTGLFQTERRTKPGSIAIPGEWNEHMNSSSLVQFENGDSINQMIMVTGKGTVRTDAGTFKAWKIFITATDSKGTSAQETGWFVPQLGVDVKGDIQMTTPEGSTMTGHVELEDSTIRLPGA